MLLPEYGVLVNLHGTHTWGEWKVKGSLKPYKSPPFKNAPKHRWVDESGKQVKHVEYWSEINA